ncbi:uncharacterized protein N0V89_004545 [Didymosphaeria variabile]|uniref:Major facilitator superfamily (MFS) profile domain-containing protein n=1 Tax=Didymosphaeria variabile TaxID=1932322 RepID=A0A9W8XS20_9PLEO|nr:uncharacterized protein N0V89_004545 [Didymosphaeria variabile]KAJ4356511.1 hypothetical protein N0V89_004545 [Didymosphaeria variabile]
MAKSRSKTDWTLARAKKRIITRELNGTTLEAFWSNLAFMLTVVISQPIYTSVSDVIGRKPPFYTGFAIFFVGSIVFALAKSMPVLIVGRLLQGLGGGGLDVLSEVILADITTLQERPLYLGLLALPMAGGGVCGPIVGAALTESAVLVLPGSATIIAFSVLAAVIVEVYRKYRWIIICNWVIASCGVGLWALWSPESSVAQTTGLQIFAGIGIGTVFTMLTIPNQTSVTDVNDCGIAAGVLVSFRLFGGLIGLAICAGVFNNVFENNISSLTSVPQELELLRDVREAVSFIPALREIDLEPDLLSPILKVYKQCFKAAFLTLAGLKPEGSYL